MKINPEERSVVLAQFSSLDSFDDLKMIQIQSFLAEHDIDSFYDTFIVKNNNLEIIPDKTPPENCRKLPGTIKKP